MTDWLTQLTALRVAWIRVEPDAQSRAWITDINASGAALFGYAPEELIGKPLTILIPAGDRARQQEAFAAACHAKEETANSIVVSVLNKDGTSEPIWHRMGSWTDAAGRHFVAIVHKIHPIATLRF